MKNIDCFFFVNNYERNYEKNNKKKPGCMIRLRDRMRAGIEGADRGILGTKKGEKRRKEVFPAQYSADSGIIILKTGQGGGFTEIYRKGRPAPEKPFSRGKRG
jgi:hypothetical protein